MNGKKQNNKVGVRAADWMDRIESEVRPEQMRMDGGWYV